MTIHDVLVFFSFYAAVPMSNKKITAFAKQAQYTCDKQVIIIKLKYYESRLLECFLISKEIYFNKINSLKKIDMHMCVSCWITKIKKQNLSTHEFSTTSRCIVKK